MSQRYTRACLFALAVLALGACSRNTPIPEPTIAGEIEGVWVTKVWLFDTYDITVTIERGKFAITYDPPLFGVSREHGTYELEETDSSSGTLMVTITHVDDERSPYAGSFRMEYELVASDAAFMQFWIEDIDYIPFLSFTATRRS